LISKENLGDVLLTKSFHSFVSEQHIQPVFCRKGDPESKGKIENVVKFIKYNFLRGRTFRDIGSLNAEALEWLERTGNGLEHGTTRRVPSEEFVLEQEGLAPYHGIPCKPVLPMREYHVRKDNTVCYRSNYYSVPVGTYRGQDTTVWLQETGGKIDLFDKETGKLAASHSLSLEKGKLVSNMSHRRVRNATREDMEKRITDYAGNDGTAALWLENLRLDKPRYYTDNLNHILRVMHTFSKPTFHEAVEVCLDKGAYNALMLTQTASTIQKRKNELPATSVPPASLLPEAAAQIPEKTNINQYSSIFQ